MFREIKTTLIPYLHPKVDLSDLHENGKLLSDQEIEIVRRMIPRYYDGRFLKKILHMNPGLKGVQFSIQKQEDELYAIYRGKKKDKQLGAGSFGSAKLAQNLNTGQWVVVKIIKADKQPSNQDKDIEIETSALQKVNLFKKNYKRTNKNSQEQFEIIMELGIGNNLEKLSQSPTKLPTQRWIGICIATLRSIKKLHEQGILNCDIKPANLTYDYASQRVTHVDFGLASLLEPGSKRALDSRKGTYYYLDPEIVGAPSGTKVHYNEKTEIYALGMTIAEILGLTEMCYDKKTDRAFMKVVEDASRAPLCKIINLQIRKHILDYLKKMTDPHSKERPTIQDAITFFNTVKQLCFKATILPYQVCYLDINQYKNQNGLDKKLIQVLKDANPEEIWLIDHDNENQTNYIRIKHELEENGLIVSHEVVQYSNADTSQMMQQYAKQQEEKFACVYEYYYMDPDGKLVDLNKIITHRHKNIILSFLKEEISRLQTDPTDKRIQLFSELIKKIEGNNHFTYNDLRDKLSLIEKDLCNTPLKYYLLDQFGFVSKIGNKHEESFNKSPSGSPSNHRLTP